MLPPIHRCVTGAARKVAASKSLATDALAPPEPSAPRTAEAVVTPVEVGAAPCGGLIASPRLPTPVPTTELTQAKSTIISFLLDPIGLYRISPVIAVVTAVRALAAVLEPEKRRPCRLYEATS